MPCGQQHQQPGVVEGAETAVRQAAGQNRVDEKVELDKEQTQHARPHQPRHLPHLCVADTEAEAVAHILPQEGRQLHEQVQHGAGGHADHQAVNAQHRREQPGAGDDGAVVEHGRDGRQQEMLHRVERAHDQAAGAEDDGACQHPAHQRGGQPLLLEREARRDQAGDEGFGEEHRQPAQDDEEQGQQVQDAAEEQPRLLLAALRPGGGKGGDEGAAQGAAGHELEEQVGDAESGQVGVQIGGGAEAGADDHLAQQARTAAEDEQQHDQRGGAGDRFAIQRPHASIAVAGVCAAAIRCCHGGR